MVPEQELPVLEQLVNIRTRLTALKQNRTGHLDPNHVVEIYASLMHQVMRLNEVRDKAKAERERARQEKKKADAAAAAASASTQVRPALEGSDRAVARSSERERARDEEGKEQDDEDEDEDEDDDDDATETGTTATTGGAGGGGDKVEQATIDENRVDTILNDVFQLLSLFFLRIGKSRESPAAYCQLGTMKRLLTHLNESGIYTEQDILPYQARLVELRALIHHGDPDNLDLDSERLRGTQDEMRDETDRDRAMTRLMLRKWDECDKLVKKLLTSLHHLSPELYPLHQHLITLRRQLAAIAARPDPPPPPRHLAMSSSTGDGSAASISTTTTTTTTTMKSPKQVDVMRILAELRQIEERRTPSGKFVVEVERDPQAEGDATTPTAGSIPGSRGFRATEDGAQAGAEAEAEHATTSEPPRPTPAATKTTTVVIEPPKGQALLSGLLQDNFDICESILALKDEQDVQRGPLRPIYERLSGIKAELDRLTLTHRWTLRETDLYNLQNELARVDALRVDGKFRDPEGNVPKGQIVLMYLLRRCYGLIYRLMASSEPVSEELMPIANKLTTIKRCLTEVAKQGGPYTARDLYPFQLALYQIDRLRTPDGKFLGPAMGSASGQGQGTSAGVKEVVPEGQAILNALLSESHEICEMLLLDEKDEEDEEEGEAPGNEERKSAEREGQGEVHESQS
ncbi:hypothetical protein JCM10212_001320 [Sporobolomyces blumeae]